MDAAFLTLTPAQRRRSLTAVILHMLGIGLTMGVTIPLTALVLERWGTDTWLIGVVAGMPAAAILLFMPFFPRVIARLGTLPSMYWGCALGIVAILLHPLFPSVGAWALLRFLIGAGMALPWLVGETWINAVALEASRGRVIAIYGAALFAGFAVGPLLLEGVGVEGWPPFVLAAGSVAVAVVPLLLARRLAPPMPAKPVLRLREVVWAAPTVAMAALVAGTLENAYYALLPLYALRNALSQALSLHLLTVLLVGGIALQFPIGWLADRGDRHLTLGALGVLSGLGALLLPLTLGNDLLLGILVFVLGGAVLAFYTVGLALLGQRFRAADLAVANATFIMLYESGSFLGPGIAGGAMDLWEPNGLIGAVTVISLLFAALAFSRAGERAPQRLPPTRAGP